MRFIPLAACMTLLLGGCNFTGEVTRLLENEQHGQHKLRSVETEELNRMLDTVGYGADAPGRTTQSLTEARLFDRLHYLFTFPKTLLAMTNYAEQQIMMPDPVSQQSIGRPEAQPADKQAHHITRLLDSAEPARRLYGLALVEEEGIGDHGDRVRALLSDPHASVRSEAVRVVGRHKYRPAADALRRMASQDADELNRIAALEALAAVDEVGSLPVMQELAGSAKSSFVRAKACELLGRYRDHATRRTVTVLLGRVRSDREWLVRDTAAGALQRITGIGIPRSADRPTVVPRAVIQRLEEWRPR